jgi:hypothetical protein
MFIPDPGSEVPSRIQNQKDSGSRIWIAPKNLSIFSQKNCFQDLGIIIWDVHPGAECWFFTHPGSGIRDQKGTGPEFGSAILP